MFLRNKSDRCNLDAYFNTRRPPTVRDFALGERVAYTRYWLRTVGASPISSLWHKRGTVVATFPHRDMVMVKWDDGDRRLVGTCNLAPFGPNSRFAD